MKSGGAFHEDGWYNTEESNGDIEFFKEYNYDGSVTKKQLNIFEVQTKIREMRDEEITMITKNDRENEWFILDNIEFYYEREDVINSLILKMGKTSQPRFQYMIQLIRSHRYIIDKMQELEQQWKYICKNMYDLFNPGYYMFTVNREDFIYVCKDLKMKDMTQEIYDRLYQALEDEKHKPINDDLLIKVDGYMYVLKEILYDINDSMWTKMLNECITAKPASISGRKTKAALRQNFDDDTASSA